MLSQQSQYVQEKLNQCGVDSEVRVMSESTHTAQQAADALGVELGQIAKSLVFMADEDPCLVIMSGDKRVCVEKLEALTGKKIRKANADQVKKYTGYQIGGVCPVLPPGYLVDTYIDESLQRFEVVWVAAGSAYAVFGCKISELSQLGNFTICMISE